MAMALTDQKPKQRDRNGEVSEGLPGSNLERGTCGEKCQELGRPEGFLLYQRVGIPATERTGRQTETKSRGVEDLWESDQLIVPERKGRG